MNFTIFDLVGLSKAAICILVLSLFSCALHGQSIATVAGNGSSGYSGDGVAASAASIDRPMGLAFDAAGNLYIGDYENKRLRKVNAAGIITTIAGSGAPGGYSGDGGPATAAQLAGLDDVAIDNATGNIYICDNENGRVRKIDASGTITTFAGSGGALPTSGDGGLATLATLNRPGAVALDNLGNVYIADVSDHRIRKVNTLGIISTIAGTGALGYSGDGGAATAALLGNPVAIATDVAGNLYIADRYYHIIRKINTSGIISTIAGTPNLLGYTGDSGPAVLAKLSYPRGIAIDVIGNIFISDSGNNVVRKIDASGIISTYAGTGIAGYSGDGGLAAAAQFNGPTQIELDNTGGLYVSDAGNNRVRKIFEVVAITISPNDTVCPGTSVTFTAVTEVGCGVTSYKWYKNGVVASTSGSTYTYLPANGDEVYCEVTASGGPCGSSVTESSNTIVVSVFPFIATGGPSTLCIGYTDTLMGVPSGGTWSSSSVGIVSVSSAGVLTGIAAGTAEITYSQGASCYATKIVSVGVSPSAGGISGTDSVCIGATITLTSTVPGGTWSSSAGAFIDAVGVLTGMVAGSSLASYTVSNAFCSVSATKNITVHPVPNAGVITGVVDVCPGARFTLSDTASGGVWSSSNLAVAVIDEALGVLYTAGAGTAIISYKVGPNVHGCSAVALATVNVLTTTFTIDGAVTDVLCFGDSAGVISLVVTPADTGYTYSWSNGSVDTAISGLPAGSYSVVVSQLATQCRSNVTFEVKSPEELLVSVDVTPSVCFVGGTLKAGVTGGVANYTYLWEHSRINYATSEVSSALSGVYTLSVTDANNCKLEKEVVLGEDGCNYVQVSEAFSPNGDGLYDIWAISGLDEYPLNTVQVFDKWGDLVYKSSKYQNDWDGRKMNGGKLPDGTYYYLVLLNEPSKTGGDNVFKGPVLIKR